MLICPSCEVVALLSSTNCLAVFPYNDNNTPKCQKCGLIARRFCNICQQTFKYNGAISIYREHIQNCIKIQLEEEEILEKERELLLDQEEKEKQEDEEKIVDQLQRIKLDAKNNVKYVKK